MTVDLDKQSPKFKDINNAFNELKNEHGSQQYIILPNSGNGLFGLFNDSNPLHESSFLGVKIDDGTRQFLFKIEF